MRNSRGRNARKNSLVHLSTLGPCAKLRRYFQLSYLVKSVRDQLRILAAPNIPTL